ncbi:MAG: hypothetical protein ACXV8Q_00565 [Methylobacter sp.]
MTATTVSGFHAAIKNAVAAHFGANVNTVAWYDQGEAADGQPLPIKTPAVILEMDSADEGDDAGDDRTPLACHITAYCILGRATPDLQIQVRSFAGQLLALARKNKWGLGKSVSFPGGFSLGGGKFDPEKNGYESWYVSWEQTLYLGTSVWDSAGVIPTEVWFGLSPEIGIPYVDKYIRGDL